MKIRHGDDADEVWSIAKSREKRKVTVVKSLIDALNQCNPWLMEYVSVCDNIVATKHHTTFLNSIVTCSVPCYSFPACIIQHINTTRAAADNIDKQQHVQAALALSLDFVRSRQDQAYWVQPVHNTRALLSNQLLRTSTRLSQILLNTIRSPSHRF